MKTRFVRTREKIFVERISLTTFHFIAKLKTKKKSILRIIIPREFNVLQIEL